MSRRPRIQLRGGTYYLLQISSAQQPLFRDGPDYQALEQLLVSALERTQTAALAFCWLPHELHLAVRSRDISVSRFMQGFTSRYAHHVHRRRRQIGHLFARRFQSLLIEPDAWLPALVRYIHHAPLRADLATSPATYPHSSHGIYLGQQRAAWVHTTPLFQILRRQGFTRLDICAYLEAPPSVDEVGAFTAHAGRSTEILGDPAFLATLPRALRTPRTRVTLTQLIDTCALTQGTSREEILSRSRSRAVSLTRALIAWHATERGIASLSAVARTLRRDPSTLSKAITRYRRLHPDLFRLDAFHHVHPLC